MHTFIGKTCRIHYNSDLSGQAIITSKGREIEVLAEDLRGFIEYVRRMERMAKEE